MDRKSKLFFSVIAVVVALSVIATFYRYAVKGDFVTYTDENALPSPWDVVNIPNP
ncbi:MAG TPA: hypothetical protein VHD69_00035 [Candidatus Paceibacterota bacterium]|nr:hypothetical protein [Candidatus Paceibacterota bacterium]